MNSSFLSSAKLGRNSGLGYLIGSLIIFFFWQILGSSVALNIAVVLEKDASDIFIPVLEFIALNSTSLMFILGVYLVVTFVHRRNFFTIITPAKKLDFNKILMGFSLYFFLTALECLGEFLLAPSDFSLSLNPSQFFIFLPAVLVFTPIQTTGEELFFRGYLLQGLGNLTENYMVLSVLSGLVFMFPHLMNPEVTQSWLLVPPVYFGIGYLFALISLKSNSIELALGAHAANNIFSALVVNYQNSVLETSSIFMMHRVDPLRSLIGFILVAFLFYWLVFKIIKIKQ